MDYAYRVGIIASVTIAAIISLIVPMHARSDNDSLEPTPLEWTALTADHSFPDPDPATSAQPEIKEKLNTRSTESAAEIKRSSRSVKPKLNSGREVLARITGFNSVAGQTDDTPCEAAGGHICGRTDVVACPTYLELGAKVSIDGRVYTCMDRTAAKFGTRFDIFCDKDFSCPAKVTGTKKVRLL